MNSRPLGNEKYEIGINLAQLSVGSAMHWNKAILNKEVPG